MKSYKQMTKEELLTIKEELEKQFEDAKGKGLSLDMSRGKPAAAQLDISMDIFSILFKLIFELKRKLFSFHQNSIPLDWI